MHHGVNIFPIYVILSQKSYGVRLALSAEDVTLFQQAEGVGFLFSAVLLHEAEGEFAAVGGGDGEEVGGRGAAGEVEGILVRTRWGEHHLFAAALHVGEPRGDNAVVRLQWAAAHLHVVALVVGEVMCFRLGEGCTGAGVEHHAHVSAVAWAWLVVGQRGCGWYLGEVEGHPACVAVSHAWPSATRCSRSPST